MELSDRGHYDARDFCFAFKDAEGKPTNVRVQQDSQEFLNMLFDRLENLLKPTSQKYLLQSIFGGQTCNIMVCKNCGNTRKVFEDFYNLSLEVADQKSVYTSLDKLVAKGIISDYSCDACNQRVDLQRRTVLASLPNVLIVHLQRIVFDFETFQNKKLNNRIEFPNVLNLRPFMIDEILASDEAQEKEAAKLAKSESLKRKASKVAEEGGEEGKDEDADMAGSGDDETPVVDDIAMEEEDAAPKDTIPIDDSEYEYKLIGVNVHMGHAMAGHYYSLINTTRSRKMNVLDKQLVSEDSPDWGKTEKEHWQAFNDSKVSSYRFADLEGEAFGGASGVDPTGFGDNSNKNAYMLFYEKRKKSPVKILVPEDEGARLDKEKHYNSIINHIQDLEVKKDEQTEETYVEADFNQFQKFVSAENYEAVHHDN